jgi:uncharacterized protein YndB with AHSA1/START domain
MISEPLCSLGFDGGRGGRTFRLIDIPGTPEHRRIHVTGNAFVLGSLRAVDGGGVVRMEDRLDTGIHDLWGALTDPSRLARWYGEVEGKLSQGGEFRVRITLSGERTGRVEACEPPQRLLLTMRDPDPQPGQPEQLRHEAQLIAEGAQTRLVWEVRGMPVNLLPAYGTGMQIHVEHLADYLSGHKLRDAESRWDELFAAYEALGVG